ncbi:MAG: hypothetical protein WAP74_01540 [Patescibacteria group bacterium]
MFKPFIISVGFTLALVTAVAAQEAAPQPTDPAATATSDTQPITEDQLGQEQNQAIASLPPAGVTNVLFLERFPERIQEFVNPGRYIPLHAQERLSEEIALKAKGDERGAERVLRAHLGMLEQMETIARAKPQLASSFNDTLGNLALCYRKLEQDQQDFEAAKRIFQEVRDQHLELAAVVNSSDEAPPGPVLDALTRANIIRPEQLGEIKTMEQAIVALRAKRDQVNKVNRETLMAMMEASLARKYLQENANAFVASRMAQLTAQATMLNDAIAADNQDTHAAMVHNMMQLAGELGYHEGFGSDPFSQQIRDTIERFRKGQKVDIGRLFEDDFRDTIAGRFKALQAGDVINPDYANRYLNIVNNYSGRTDVGGFDPERFRRNLTDFGYDPNKFKDFEERQRKMREAGENCYRQNKVPFVKNFENAEIECRERSYVAGPSPEQYRAKQEECAKQGKGVRWLGGDRLECEGSISPSPTYSPGPTGSPVPCPSGQVYDSAVPGCRPPCPQNYWYNPGPKACEPNSGGGGGTATYCGPGMVYGPGGGCVAPTSGSCQPYEYYSGQENRCVPTSPPGSGGGPPISPCGQGQYWEGNGQPPSWRCVNYYNPANSTQCAPGFHWVSGTSSTSSGCWPGQEGGSTSTYTNTYTSTYTPPTYTGSYSPYCSSAQSTPGSGWYINPNTTCPSGQYVTEWCPTKAKVAEEQANAARSNYSYSYPGTAWTRCPNPPAQ